MWMVGLETVPYIGEFELPKFLEERYGSVSFELEISNSEDRIFRIILGDKDVGRYSVSYMYTTTHVHERKGMYREEISGPYPTVRFEIMLLDYNGGKPMALDGVFKNSIFIRHDAWGELEGIPLKD